MSETSFKTTVEWKDIPWRKLQRKIFKLQKRIYQASQRGDVVVVRRLQKLLMKSWSAKCLSVRRVTQDNQGKKTAGVDGIKSLSPEARLILVNELELGTTVSPTRRVWIPKPGKDEKRPLGIPTMHDRALQALVKLALEPEWEAKFEPNSYGFRPGRSCHDAISQIFSAIRYKPKYVLDADIAKCFDRINHEALLSKLNTSPSISRQIRAWLKAGVIDGNKLFPTDEGTPQGGIISPLLANIALHGLEDRITKAFPKRSSTNKRKADNPAKVVRYADDFVILHEDLEVIQKCKEFVSEWLKDMGLELKPSKTRISHTLENTDGKVGFEFLGFEIKQISIGKYRTGKSPQGEPLGFKTIITPSMSKVKEHTDRIGTIIRQHKDAPKAALIARLNPVIRGWANYYSAVISKRIYQKVDQIVYQQLMAWANHRHQNTKYAQNNWKSIGSRNWVFATDEGLQLIDHADTPIVRYVKVKGEKSPYDGDWIYWSRRKGEYPETPRQISQKLKIQKGKCTQCGLYFTSESLIETHHKDGNHSNNKRDNLILVHRHCHDKIHAMWEVNAWEMRSDELYIPSPNPQKETEVC